MALWKDVTEKSPRNGRGWMNYGLTQMGEAKYVEASHAFDEALKTVPFYPTLHINIGILELTPVAQVPARALIIRK